MLNAIKLNLNHKLNHKLKNSKNEIETNDRKEKLISDLNQFGLCPYDWTIEPNKLSQEKCDKVIIQNKLDSEFKFLGRLDTCHSKWKSLTLISL